MTHAVCCVYSSEKGSKSTYIDSGAPSPSGMTGAYRMGLMDDKVVIISGVGPGLGRSAAAATLREGGSVVLGDLDGGRLTRLAAELDAPRDRVAHAEADITSRAACERLVALARQRFGRLDAVVHVAAHSTS